MFKWTISPTNRNPGLGVRQIRLYLTALQKGDDRKRRVFQNASADPRPFNVLYKSSRDGGAPRERIRKRATDMRHQQSFSCVVLYGTAREEACVCVLTLTRGGR